MKNLELKKTSLRKTNKISSKIPGFLGQVRVRLPSLFEYSGLGLGLGLILIPET